MYMTGKMALIYALLSFTLIRHVDMIKCDPLKHKYYHEQLSECLDCEKCLIGNEKIDISDWHFDYDYEVGPTRCRPCKPCSSGTFSNIRAFKCQRCKNCTLSNQHEVEGCSTQSDSVCDGIIDPSIPKPKEIRGDNTETPFTGSHSPVTPLIVAVTMLVVFIAVLIIGFLIHIYRKRKYRGSQRMRNNQRCRGNAIESGSSLQRTNDESDEIFIDETDTSHQYNKLVIQESNESKRLLGDAPKEETVHLNKESNNKIKIQQKRCYCKRKTGQARFDQTKHSISYLMNERRDITYSAHTANMGMTFPSEQTPLILKSGGRKRYNSLPCDENDTSCCHDMEGAFEKTSPDDKVPLPRRKKNHQRKYSLIAGNSFENKAIEEEPAPDLFADGHHLNASDITGMSSYTIPQGSEIKETCVLLPGQCNDENILETPMTREQMRILSRLCITDDQIYLGLARSFGLTERDLTQIKYDNRFESLMELSYQIFVKILEKRMPVTLEEIRSVLFKLDKKEIWNEFCSK